jgi:hypothetical protein
MTPLIIVIIFVIVFIAVKVIGDWISKPKAVENAYINRIKAGNFYHNYASYDLTEDAIRILTDDYLEALHGTKSSFYIADKNHTDNKIKTDNTQGNIGHSTLMFPNGEFYDYSSNKYWASPDKMFPNIFLMLLSTHKLTASEKWPLVLEFLEENIKPKEYITAYKIIDKIRKTMKKKFPEYLL